MDSVMVLKQLRVTGDWQISVTSQSIVNRCHFTLYLILSRNSSTSWKQDHLNPFELQWICEVITIKFTVVTTPITYEWLEWILKSETVLVDTKLKNWHFKWQRWFGEIKVRILSPGYIGKFAIFIHVCDFSLA